ncbi:MAG TPA: hypothetical protein VJ276_00440 [Thermoanaerobaculia bacterium]|nr:hypothetical protein [Thermoanaerobaculia bacterium]
MKSAVALALFLLSAALPLVAAPPKPVAPPSITHNNAMFLASLCGAGKTKITLKAQALGTRFFLEEPAGVTVYAFDGSGYTKEKFFKGLTLDQAVKKYRR